MSTVVHVNHPVPLRYAERRGGPERLAYLRGITPVALREAPSSEFAALPDPKHCGVAYHAHGGGLWEPLRTRGKDVTPQALVAYLAGESYTTRDESCGLWRRFGGTPVCAIQREGRFGQIPTRGVVDAPGEAARVVIDHGGERAARAVRDFLENDVVIAGGRVFVRCFGPLAVASEQTSALGVLTAPWTSPSPQILCRLDRVSEFTGFLRRRMGADEADLRSPARLVESHRHVAESGLLRDDDLLVLANHTAELLDREIAEHLKTLRGEPDRRERLGEVRRRIRPLVVDGWTTSIGMDRVEEVLNTLRDAIREADLPEPLSSRHLGTKRGSGLALRADYIDGVALPRIQQPTMTPDDAEAFGALGPGGL